MKNPFQSDAVDEVMSRVAKLQPTAQRPWGKMDVVQMVAHCAAALDFASGRLIRPCVLVGRLIGPLVRSTYSNDKPFSKNSPTDKKLVISDPRDFSREREQLKVRVLQCHQGGEAQCTKHPHPFFGALTPQEWGTGIYNTSSITCVSLECDRGPANVC